MKTTPFQREDVKAKFDQCNRSQRNALMRLREAVFSIAAEHSVIGPLEETLKWGEASYLTSETKSGTTIRMSTFGDGQVALFFNCQTLLVERFRQRFGDALQYSKNRAVVIDPTETIPIAEIRQCILMALTYHEAKKNHSVYA